MVANNVLYLVIILSSIVILISLIYIGTYSYSKIKLRTNVDNLINKSKELMKKGEEKLKEEDDE